MKKIISVLMVCLMIATMCTLNVFAARVVGGSAGTVADGVENFDDNSTSTGDVNLVVGTVGHRYAVDITFADMTLQLGNVVWDVNGHKYVAASGNSVENGSYAITIDNHSDLPVYAKGVVAAEPTASTLLSGAGITTAMASGAENIDIIAATTAGAQQGTLTVEVKSGNWDTSLEKLIANGATASQTIKIATVTVTISKNDIS